MASSRQTRSAGTTGKKTATVRVVGRKAATGVMKAEHRHRVVRKPSAEAADRSERKEPYPVGKTRK